MAGRFGRRGSSIVQERRKASTGLAKIIRAKLSREAVERLRRQRAREVQKATLCQALFRALICRRIMRKKIERRRKCANDIQRAWRGYKGRKRGYAKRMIVAECWRMVGSVSPEVRKIWRLYCQRRRTASRQMT